MTLGEKIWRLRESRNMSQEELAEKLGVSRQTVSNWENDKAVLDAEKLATLCSVFGVSADDMLIGEGVPQPVTQKGVIEANPKAMAGRRLVAIIFAIIALVLIVTAVVGLIVSEDKVSVSSLITFHSDFIWFALFIFGGAALIGAVIAFLRKK